MSESFHFRVRPNNSLPLAERNVRRLEDQRLEREVQVAQSIAARHEQDRARDRLQLARIGLKPKSSVQQSRSDRARRLAAAEAALGPAPRDSGSSAARGGISTPRAATTPLRAAAQGMKSGPRRRRLMDLSAEINRLAGQR